MRRVKSLDCLKAVAMGGVLVMHLPGSDTTRSLPWQFFNQACRFAVPCFFLTSGFFFARSYLKAADGRAVIVRYVGRLLTLFLFWAFFYAVVPPFKGDPTYNTPVIQERLAYIAHHPKYFLLSGYAMPLWFLSSLVQAVFLVGCCLYVRRPWLALTAGGGLFLIALLGAPYAHAAGWRGTFDMKEGPFFSLLFVAIGASAAVYDWRLDVRVAVLLALAGFIITMAEVWLLQDPARQVTVASHDFTVGTLPYAVGIFFWALDRPGAGPDWLAWVGTRSLGVYVLHFYVIKLLGLLPVTPALVRVPPLYLAVVYALALAVSVGLARLPFARRLVT